VKYRPPDPEPDDIDIGVGRYGLRTFRPKIVRGEPYLCSVSQDPIPNLDPSRVIPARWRELMVGTHPVAWQDGTCIARCQRTRHGFADADVISGVKDHEPPVRDCGCGIYALDDLKDLHHEYRRDCEHVVAVISASGRTIECRNGIRTKFARVVAYWVLDHSKDCRCHICLRTGLKEWSSNRRWDSHSNDFPYLGCAMRQFKNADRWDEPDEMAKHYGLKATPLRRLPPGAWDMDLGSGGRRGYSIEIPMGLL